MKIYCCPICACSHPTWLYKQECPDCHNIITSLESKYRIDHYAEEAQKKYGNPNYARIVLAETEIYTNPLFNSEVRQNVLNKNNRNYYSKKNYDYTPPTVKPLPKCPTCQSTNIKKISFAKGYLHWRMLGVFSKTAMSQWECKSCGSKW